jgi:hypothetical protein
MNEADTFADGLVSGEGMEEKDDLAILAQGADGAFS